MEWDWPSIIFFNGGSDLNHPNNWVYHYQSLIAGMLALISAIVTTFVLIIQQKSIVRRSHSAALAKLPIALSRLHRYADNCLYELSCILRGRDEEDNIKYDFEVPSLPDESLQIITMVIENGSRNNAKFLQALLRQIQVQNSRLHSTARDTSSTRNVGHITIAQNVRYDVLDAYILKTMADHIFDFARLKTNRIGRYDAETAQPSGMFYLERDFGALTRDYVTEKLTKYVAKSFNHGNS